VKSLFERFHHYGALWGVTIESRLETETSLLGFGTRAGAKVVLKVIRKPPVEWEAGRVLSALEDASVVRCIAHEPGALLMERAWPGYSLSTLVEDGRDDAATEVLAHLMSRWPAVTLSGVATAMDWSAAFEQYLESKATVIDHALVREARDQYVTLCDTQGEPILLHGDLHHYNVVFDEQRGWSAIDPKGVMAEREFEIAPLLWNPDGQPLLYASREIVLRRIRIVCSRAGLNQQRVMRWAFAQSVLSLIWSWQDYGSVAPNDSALLLASSLRLVLNRP